MVWSAGQWGVFAGGAFAGISGLSLVGTSVQEDLVAWRGAAILTAFVFALRLLFLAIRRR